MANVYVLEDGSGGYLMEDGTFYFIENNGVVFEVDNTNPDWLISSTGLTITKQNLSGSGTSAKANTSNTSGYLEIAIGPAAPVIGLHSGLSVLNDWPGEASNSIGYRFDGTVYLNGSVIVTISSYANGDIIGIALKNGKVYFRKNGVWQNSADPVAETGGIDISATITSPVPTAAGFGTDILTFNFGASAFTYNPPTGLPAWDGTTH